MLAFGNVADAFCQEPCDRGVCGGYLAYDSHERGCKHFTPQASGFATVDLYDQRMAEIAEPERLDTCMRCANVTSWFVKFQQMMVLNDDGTAQPCDFCGNTLRSNQIPCESFPGVANLLIWWPETVKLPEGMFDPRLPHTYPAGLKKTLAARKQAYTQTIFAERLAAHRARTV